MIPAGLAARAAVALAVAAGAALAGWTVRGWRADAAEADLRADHAQAVAAAHADAAEKVRLALLAERAVRTEIEGIADEERKRGARLRADVAGLRAERDRLRDAIADAASQPSASDTAGAACGGSTAAAPGLVPGRLLDEGSEAIVELAAALADARARGLACERAYEVARLRLDGW